MKNKRNEIYELKESIYSANIEKSKLNEKLFSLKEMSKKVEDGYNSYKEVESKVDNVKSIKDVMNFKNIVLKNKIPVKHNSASKNVVYKGENAPAPEFVTFTELKDAFNKLHYNDKMTLEENKVYTATECKEIFEKNKANSDITMYAALTDERKYELQTNFCETMITAYPSMEKLREKITLESDLLIIDVLKNAHYIPVMTPDGGFCGLVGGDMQVLYKEKINTGKESINIWHARRKG